MSLSIYLTYQLCIPAPKPPIYVSVGDIWELSDEECDYYLGITHNLGEMASQCGLYNPLWRPYRLYNIKDDSDEAESFRAEAGELLDAIEWGLKELKSNPQKYKSYNPSNGWGSYEGLVEFTEKYICMIKKFPDSLVEVSR